MDGSTRRCDLKTQAKSQLSGCPDLTRNCYVVYDLISKSELLLKKASAQKGKPDKESDVPF
jgi:hypothetical protein